MRDSLFSRGSQFDFEFSGDSRKQSKLKNASKVRFSDRAAAIFRDQKKKAQQDRQRQEQEELAIKAAEEKHQKFREGLAMCKPAIRAKKIRQMAAKML